MKIGILTSGGDAPGMNAFVSKFVTIACEKKHEIVGFKFGFQGLIDGNVISLNRESVSNISHLGGSYIKCSRCSEFLTKTGIKKALTTLKINDIKYLVVLGGEGTLKGAKELAKNGINIAYIPATIDNDLLYTNETLGFDSAVNAAVEEIDKTKQTMLSLNRIFICEVMGRHCPDIASNTSLATDATITILEKEDYSFGDVVSKIKTAISLGEESPLIVIRENILDVYKLSKQLQNELDVEVRACKIGYVQRGTHPSVIDRILARNFATKAIELIEKNSNSFGLGKIESKIINKNLLEI